MLKEKKYVFRENNVFPIMLFLKILIKRIYHSCIAIIGLYMKCNGLREHSGKNI